MIRIRAAEKMDDAKIGELLVEAFVRTYAEKMPEVVVTERRVKDLRDVESKRAIARVLVAEEEGEVVGSVTLFSPGSPSSRAWLPGFCDLRYMGVNPRFHGRGIAGELLRAAEAQAREWGAQGISLHVRRGATGLAAMYERAGYERAPEGDADLLPEIFLEARVKNFGRLERI